MFPPLRLGPRVITLVIGVTFQVLAHGGPHDDSIVYSTTGEEAGEVTSGLITGLKFGDCFVVGQVQLYLGILKISFYFGLIDKGEPKSCKSW